MGNIPIETSNYFYKGVLVKIVHKAFHLKEQVVERYTTYVHKQQTSAINEAQIYPVFRGWTFTFSSQTDLDLSLTIIHAL